MGLRGNPRSRMVLLPPRSLRPENDPTVPVPFGDPAVSSFVMLVLLLLVLVSAMVIGGLAYLVHRHPAAGTPAVAALAGAAVLAACVIPIAVR